MLGPVNRLTVNNPSRHHGKKAIQTLNSVRRNLPRRPLSSPHSWPVLKNPDASWRMPLLGAQQCQQHHGQNWTSPVKCSNNMFHLWHLSQIRKLTWDSFQQQQAYSRVLMIYWIHIGLAAFSAIVYLNPVCLHHRLGNQTYADSVQHKHMQANLSQCKLPVKHSGRRYLPAVI